jgi:phosphoserine phosphatase
MAAEGEVASGEFPSRGAAFFDLDKTLMQGSSAFQFGRAAFQAGLMGRRQLLADGLANLQFRLRGATDADSLALRERIAASL